MIKMFKEDKFYVKCEETGLYYNKNLEDYQEKKLNEKDEWLAKLKEDGYLDFLKQPQEYIDFAYDEYIDLQYSLEYPEDAMTNMTEEEFEYCYLFGGDIEDMYSIPIEYS